MITAVEADDEEVLPVHEISQNQPLLLDSQVESWMKNLTDASQASLNKEFFNFASSQAPAQNSRRPPDRERMTQLITQNIGQILLTYNQIEWTQNVKAALAQMNPEMAVGANNPLKKLRNIYKKKIETYI